MAKKHEFFDSGLLYKFCINFRRRRRLSELLNESEQDDDEGVAVPTQEDSHPDSPFVLRKSPPQEGNSAFQTGKKNKKICSFCALYILLWILILHNNFTTTLITVGSSKELKQVTSARRSSLNSLQLLSAGFPPFVQLSSTSVRCNPKSGKCVVNMHVTNVSNVFKDKCVWVHCPKLESETVEIF